MKRALMYAGLIIVAFLLQNNIFASIGWISITPNLMLIITFCFGFIHGTTSGMSIGFVSGILLDFFFGTNIGYFALIYTLIGYGNGLLGQIFYNEMLNMPVALCLINDMAFGLYIFVFSFVFKGNTDFIFYLMHIIIPEMIYTAIITLIVYRPLLKYDELITRWEAKSAKSYV